MSKSQLILNRSSFKCSWILEVKICNLIMKVFMFKIMLFLLCSLTYFFTLIDWAHGRGGGFCDCGILDKGWLFYLSKKVNKEQTHSKIKLDSMIKLCTSRGELSLYKLTCLWWCTWSVFWVWSIRFFRDFFYYGISVNDF